MPFRTLTLCAAISVTSVVGAARAQEFEIPEAFQTYCVECHQGADVEGDFDLDMLFGRPGADSAAFHARLQAVAGRIRGGTMPPPPDTMPPEADEKREMIALLAAMAPRVPGARVATMRRLTRRQYEHTVRALFGIRWWARGLLPDDATAHGFEGVGDVQNVSPLMFEKYVDAATDVATLVLANGTARDRTFGPDEAIADALPRLLRRAYRRPVEQEEIDALVADFGALRARGVSVERARHAILRAVLASPSFLFRAELGQPDAPWRLTAHELATRLAYMLTSGPPDDELRACADDASLLDRDVLVAQARRLARRQQGRGLADDFATQWLSLRDVLTHTADTRRFRAIWNHRLRPALRDEVVHQFAYVVRENRSVLELLDADYTFVDGVLAKHYGLPAPKEAGMQRVELSDRRRGGVLGAGAMLMSTSFALRTSPVKRGQWILTKLLDAPPPPPPPDAGTLPKDDKNKKGLTLREQLERHRRDPACASCHAEMDALGFALEHYDPLGRWRDDVHGQPVDAEAELPDGTPVDGPIALKDALLARADEFVRAFAKNLLVHGVGRDMTLVDEPELTRIVARTRSEGDRFEALLESVVTSPLFTMRDPDHSDEAPR